MTRRVVLETSLHQVFDFDRFRAGQLEAITALEAGRDVQVLLPTGGGKSLCYQLPGIHLARERNALTLVVSPLIALMEDQVTALRARDIPAIALHSGMSWAAQSEAMAAIAQTGGLIYASPERVAVKRFRSWLARQDVGLVAIDEAHCISEWGHDFRKDYRKLGVLEEELGVPMIALTATATPRVMDEIRTSLHLRDPLVVQGDFCRPNLALSVEHEQGDKARTARVVALVREVGVDRGSGRAVIYAATRKRVKAIADALRKEGIAAGYYHAGRTDTARSRAHAAYEDGRRPVLVATTAFGMGVDHPDVRLVAHAQAPGSLEAYYQQAGRAGRDGNPARCVLLYSSKDAITQARLRGSSPPPGVVAGWEALQAYVFGTTCRQQALVSYFTGEPGASCGACDVCTGGLAVRQAVALARAGHRERAVQRTSKQRADAAVTLDPSQRELVVAFVGALRKPLGKRQVALGLRGSLSKVTRRKGLPDNPHFGTLRGVPEVAIARVVEELLAEGRLVPKGKKYPTVWLPNKAVRPPRDPSKPARPRGYAPASSLEAALKRFRRSQSTKLRWKPYQVFDNATLQAIAAQRPRTLEDLRAVPGMGDKRVARFGEGILDIVAAA